MRREKPWRLRKKACQGFPWKVQKLIFRGVDSSVLFFLHTLQEGIDSHMIVLGPDTGPAEPFLRPRCPVDIHFSRY
jgi:hypothetical protein